jgi:hypothetical protein
MKKAEIIVATMRHANESGAETIQWTGPKASYAEYLLATLTEKFEPLDHTEVLTCADFGQLGLECCSVCHDEYPDELKVIQIRSRSDAWVCCAVERAISGTVPGDRKVPSTD